jgi:protein SCO1
MKHIFLLLSLALLISCEPQKKALPYLGQSVVDTGTEVHHTVGQFSHYNQDSVLVDNATMSEFVYIADFFFTSCPSICPKVAKEMLKIYEATKDMPDVKLVSFTIDPKRDDVAKLHLYADNLNINHDKWYFLTGDKDATLALANTYFVAALEDPTAPGGFDHSGKIILVDKKGHVRSFSEGTDPTETPKLIRDISILLEEYHTK